MGKTNEEVKKADAVFLTRARWKELVQSATNEAVSHSMEASQESSAQLPASIKMALTMHDMLMVIDVTMQLEKKLFGDE